ncbi:MAG: ABC-2 type transporter [candidate division BRC1 bacterium ADurb.BinA292]|nr:MAG: ABC-2 type transporter [candidate division BRC1 bacterium ADurb.BinA292]
MKIYTAEAEVLQFRHVWTEMIRGIIHSRYLAYRLFLKDLRAEYSRLKFSLVWDFLEPLMLALVFIALMHSGVVSDRGIEMPPAVFITFGVLMWMTFSEAVTMPLGVVGKSRHLVTQTSIVPEALILSVVWRVAFNSIFRIAILAIVAAALGSLSPVGFLKFLLLFPAIVLLGLALGILLAPFNTIYNDIGRFVNILLRPLMYASPVLYARSMHPLLDTFNACSPVSIVLVNLRSLATRNVLEQPGLLASCVGMSLLFLVGWFIFHVSIPVVAERA